MSISTTHSKIRKKSSNQSRISIGKAPPLLIDEIVNKIVEDAVIRVERVDLEKRSIKFTVECMMLALKQCISLYNFHHDQPNYHLWLPDNPLPASQPDSWSWHSLKTSKPVINHSKEVVNKSPEEQQAEQPTRRCQCRETLEKTPELSGSSAVCLVERSDEERSVSCLNSASSFMQLIKSERTVKLAKGNKLPKIATHEWKRSTKPKISVELPAIRINTGFSRIDSGGADGDKKRKNE